MMYRVQDSEFIPMHPEDTWNLMEERSKPTEQGNIQEAAQLNNTINNKRHTNKHIMKQT